MTGGADNPFKSPSALLSSHAAVSQNRSYMCMMYWMVYFVHGKVSDDTCVCVFICLNMAQPVRPLNGSF